MGGLAQKLDKDTARKIVNTELEAGSTKAQGRSTPSLILHLRRANGNARDDYIPDGA
jgi:hypothetical protein